MFRYRFVVFSLPKLISHALRKDQKRIEHEVFELFSRMGGIYIKFLQVLVSNTGSLSTISQDRRMSVFSESPPSPVDHMAILEAQLSDESLRKIKQIEPRPFATGSFANVYLAILTNGQRVIIKIKRPGLDKQLKKDLFTLRFVVRLYASVKNDRFNLTRLADEYAEGIKREVNYKKEVKNALYLYEEYMTNPEIVVPKTYKDLSTKDVIVQDYLEGMLLSEAMKEPAVAEERIKNALGSNLKVQLAALATNMLERCFSGLVIHGDPHPGNIILLQDDKVGFIDFGLLADPPADPIGFLEYNSELTYIHKGQFRPGKFGLTMLRSYSLRLFHALHFVDNNFEGVRILDQLERLMDSRFYNKAGHPDQVVSRMKHGHSSEIFDSVINPENELSLVSDIDGLMMRRAFQVIWGSIMTLGVYEEIAPAINLTAVQRGKASGDTKSYNGPPRNVDESFEIIGNWLGALRESDPVFYSSIRNLIPKTILDSR